jgi:hypothetical protein
MDDPPVVGAVPDRTHIGVICVPRARSIRLLDARRAGEGYSLTVAGIDVRIHSAKEFSGSKRQRAVRLGPGKGQAASRGAAAGRAGRGPGRVFAHRRTGSVPGHSRRLSMRGDRQLNGPVPGHRLADDLVHR